MEPQTPTPPVNDEKPLPEKEGFDAGFGKGKALGYDQGHAEGLALGEKKGYDAGFKKGESEAEKRVQERSRAVIASLEKLMATMDSHWQDLVRDHEEQILSLISRIAEKVVLATVELDRDVVRRSILSALDTLPEPREIVLNVSPEDYEYIDTIKEDFFDTVKSLTRISVISNASVSRGGCTVETPDARVRTDVASRLEAVVESMLGGDEP
jgi:flagellar assembly protein FliH